MKEHRLLPGTGNHQYFSSAGIRRSHAWRLPMLALVMLGVIGLAGCSSIPAEREEALGLYGEGQYEAALGRLDAGLIKHPDNAYLRTAQLRIKQESVTRLVLQAGEHREAGRFDDAESVLKRAQQIDPRSERVKGLQLDVARDRRLSQTLASAEAALAKKQTDKALALIEQGLKDNPRHSALQNLQRKIELEQRMNLEAEGGRLSDTRPISLEFRDAPVRAVLDVVSRTSGVNFIFDKDVRTDLKTTVFLKQSRIEDALELIASTNQLAIKVLNPKTVLIFPNTSEKVREYQDLLVRVFYLAHADAKQTAAVLKATLKLRDAQVDERLNTILIRESSDTVRLAERIVALQDVADPEVLLDVSVLEVATTRLTELGIQPPTGFSLTALPLPGQSNLTVAALEGLNNSRIGVGLGSLQVNLRAELGDLHVLANPKIRAKNREKAKVLIGDKIPIISSSTNTASNFVSESITYQDVGLKLEVEPMISLDDEVQIKVALEVSSLGKEVRTNNSVAYQIGTRTATTVLKLRDGETQLLAGLISKEDRASSAGFPGLGELPIAGRLFSSKRNNGQQTEIVLAITPRIVRNVRRPDVNQSEFWSGSETRVRLRPLALPEDNSSIAATAPADALNAAAPSAAHSNATTPNAPAAPTNSAATTTAAQVLGAAPPASTAPTINLRIELPKSAKAGEIISVPVYLNNTIPLRGSSLSLQLDPAQFEFIEAQEGPLFRKGDAPVSLTSRHDTDSKTLVLGLMRTSDRGVVGKEAAVIVKLKVLGKGTHSVGLISGSVIPEGGAAIQLGKQSGYSLLVE